MTAAFLAAMSMLTFLGPSAAAADPGWEESLSRAERLADDGRIGQAAEAAQSALREAEKNLGPEAPEVIHILSRLVQYHQNGGDGAALALLEKRLAGIETKNAEAWRSLGRILRGRRGFSEAEDALRRAMDLKPDDPDTEQQLGLLYSHRGKYEKAAELLQKSLDGHPEQSYVTYVELARCYRRLGREAAAREVIARGKKDARKGLNFYIQKGYFNLNSGEDEQAKNDFQSLIAIDTASPSGYHHLGYYFYVHRRLAEAERYLRHAVKMQEDDPQRDIRDFLHSIVTLGDILHKDGRDAENIPLYRKGLAATARDSDLRTRILWELARVYASQGKTAEAEDLFKQAYAACERLYSCSLWMHGQTLVDLAELHAAQGRKAEAKTLAARGRRLFQDVVVDPKTVGALHRMASLHMRLDDSATGEKLFLQSIPITEESGLWDKEADAFEGLANAYQAQGRGEEAEAAREQARALRP
jgi:tetratricopeptide (TPR) repeat protein